MKSETPLCINSKFQIPNNKQISNPNFQNLFMLMFRNFKNLGFVILVIVICLLFVI